MSAEWNIERILSLAPDPASAKAGQSLGSIRSWSNLGAGHGLVWGECLGSGSKPYQTKLDPAAPAFSCSCPSRKFPCKHSIGLMIVWAEGPDRFAEGELPSWVVSWKENREKRSEGVKEKKESGPANPVAKAKREGARVGKVAAGLDDLSLWISDLVRQGFTTLATKPSRIWDEQARRMVDAQAPGVARRLRQIEAMTLAGDGWQTALLDRLSQIHLLHEGFRRLDAIPAEVAEDIRTTIGFTIDLDSVRALSGVRDHWRVIGQSSTIEDRLTVVRTWLVGRETGRTALILDFAAGNRPVEILLPPGFAIDAELAFFPGSYPLRALVKERIGEPILIDRLPGSSIASAFIRFGEALAKNPWIELIPVIFEDVFLQQRDGAWSIRDALDAVLPLSKRFNNGWQLLGMSGGGPMTLAGEFDGSRLEALSVWVGRRLFLMTASEPITARPGSTPPNWPILADATASAVVGIDRRPPPKREDDVIGRTLEGLEGREPPAQLLAIAATASLYARVGRKPAVDRSPLTDPSPEDDTLVCPPGAPMRLRKILGGDQSALLLEWLRLLAKAGKRLPNEALAEVLALGRQRTELRQAILNALGCRGHWLASLNSDWSYVGGEADVADPDVIWQTGTRAERLTVLKNLRTSDPSRARELVRSTWTKEPADERTAFVETFTIQLTTNDEPFLESALDDRSKTVRKAATTLLAKLPNSALASAWTNAAPA